MNNEEELLRRTLDQLAQEQPDSETYPALLRMLDRRALKSTWNELKDKPIRVWNAVPLKPVADIIDTIENDVRAGILELFTMGILVFTVGMDPQPEIHWSLRDRFGRNG